MIKKGSFVKLNEKAINKYSKLLGDDLYGTYVVVVVSVDYKYFAVKPHNFKPISYDHTTSDMILKSECFKDITRLKKIERLMR